jgi:hypothetical protein
MLTALFGIDDGSLSLAVNLLILVLIVVWIALIWWTYADARRRIDDPVLVTTATAASLFPFIGTVVYTILRPPEFLADQRERELETKAAELRLRRLAETSCPRCEHPVELSWLRCPECQHRLKDPCRSCGRPVDPRWAICPHCESAVSAGRQARPGEQRQRGRPSGRGRPAGEAQKERGRSAAKQPPTRRSQSAPGAEGGARRKPPAEGARRKPPPEGARRKPPAEGGEERGEGREPRDERDEGERDRGEERERSRRRKPTPRT